MDLYCVLELYMPSVSILLGVDFLIKHLHNYFLDDIMGVCNFISDGFGFAGRLHVCDSLDNSASICANEFEAFNDVAATVACKTLGYETPGCEYFSTGMI